MFVLAKSCKPLLSKLRLRLKVGEFTYSNTVKVRPLFRNVAELLKARPPTLDYSDYAEFLINSPVFSVMNLLHRMQKI